MFLASVLVIVVIIYAAHKVDFIFPFRATAILLCIWLATFIPISLIAPRGFIRQAFTHFVPTKRMRVVTYVALAPVLNFALMTSLEATVRDRITAGIPPIVEAQAKTIREHAASDLSRLRLVQAAMMHCIQYDSNINIWGEERIPTLPEVLDRRRERKWVYPRGDCKTRAVYMGALLTALKIEWKIEASVVFQHMWVRARADGQWYDLGAKLPETPRDERLLWLYTAGALRKPNLSLRPDWMPRLPILRSPEMDWLALLGFAYRSPNGGFVFPDFAVDWRAEPAGDDFGKRMPAASAGFPYGEPL